MSEKTLYERLGAMTRSVQSPRTCCRARSRIRDCNVSGTIEERTAASAKNNSWSIFSVRVQGGPLYYTGRDMKMSHTGMQISESDWSAFMGHVNATLDACNVPQTERSEVAAFVQSLKADIVEV